MMIDLQPMPPNFKGGAYAFVFVGRFIGVLTHLLPMPPLARHIGSGSVEAA